MPPVGYEPATPTNERPQTHTVDGSATGKDFDFFYQAITWAVRNRKLLKSKQKIIFSNSFSSSSSSSSTNGHNSDSSRSSLGYSNVPQIY